MPTVGAGAGAGSSAWSSVGSTTSGSGSSGSAGRGITMGSGSGALVVGASLGSRSMTLPATSVVSCGSSFQLLRSPTMVPSTTARMAIPATAGAEKNALRNLITT